MDNIKSKYNLGFSCCAYADEAIWFPSFLGNGLFRCKGGKTEYMGKFSCESEDGEDYLYKYIQNLYGSIQVYGKKLVFVPHVARNIAIYDIERNVFSYIPIRFKYEEKRSLFTSSVISEHYLYMFPSLFKGIVKVNLENGDMECIDGWLQEIEKYITHKQDILFGFDYIRRNDVLYLPLCQTHAILEFRLEDDSWKLHDIGETGYSSIADDGTYLWLIPRQKGKIVRWNPENGDNRYYDNFPNGYLPGYLMTRCVYDSGCIWIFSYSGNMVLKLDSIMGIISEEKIFAPIFEAKYNDSSLDNAFFIYCGAYKNKLLLCTGKTNEVLLFDTKSKSLERCKIELPKELEKYYQGVLDNRRLEQFKCVINGGGMEDEVNNLTFLIKYLSCQELAN